MGTRIRTDDSLSEPAWIWDIAVSEEITDIGLVIAQADLTSLRRRFRTLNELFLHQVRKHADLDLLSSLVSEATPFRTCSFQDMVAHRSTGENWVAVGEAAFVVDAILSSGVTLALRTGFFASRIIAHALAGGGERLSPKWCQIYHEKTAASASTVNGLIDVLWYRGRLRSYYPLMLNVASILFFNFNLNHLHTRYTPRTFFELRLLKLLHRGIDRFVPVYDAYLTERALRRARLSRRSEQNASPGDEAGCRV